jgi:C4-dicarboxylate transporter
MKRRVLILTLVVLLSLVAAALVWGQDDAPFSTYAVAPGTAAGQGYRLTSLGWHVDRAVAGGAYQLVGPASTVLRGSGCCCTYVPCVMRDF